MINGFEIETAPLSDYEKEELLPIFVAALKKKIGEEKAVTGTQICRALKDEGYKINGARVRKIINHIRIFGLVPCLVATSKGYYVAQDGSTAEKYLESLDQRIGAISAVRNAFGTQSRAAFN